MNDTKNQLIQTGFNLDRLHQDKKISDEAYTILKDRNKQSINYSQCCTKLPTIIEIDFDGHLKAQIQTTDLKPEILKAVDGYGNPVDCKNVRINEV